MSPGALTGWSLVALLTVAHAVTDTLSSTRSVLLPTVQARFGLGETMLAALVATLWVSTSLAQPLFGVLSDRPGSRRVAITGVGLGAVLLSLLAVVPSAALLFAVLLLGGLGSAAYHLAATSLARLAGGRRSELAVSLFSAGGTLGLALGPVVLLVIVGAFGIGAAPWLMVPGLLLTLVLALRLPADQPRPTTRPALLDRRVAAGPVGLLSLAATVGGVAYVTFGSASRSGSSTTPGCRPTQDSSAPAWPCSTSRPLQVA